MYIVKTRWWERKNPGSQAEYRVLSAWTENGPFSTRAAAETFASAIAASDQIAEVRIEFTDEAA